MTLSSTTTILLPHLTELQKFLEADPKTVTWGQDTFNLEYQGEEADAEKGRSHLLHRKEIVRCDLLLQTYMAKIKDGSLPQIFNVSQRNK